MGVFRRMDARFKASFTLRKNDPQAQAARSLGKRTDTESHDAFIASVSLL
jgi:hypothetical protein